MKQAVVERGVRPTGRYDDPASSAGVSPGRGATRLDDTEDGVRAVLVERADASCVLYRGGLVGEWPSVGLAWAAIKAFDPRLEWRRSTPGVWIGDPGSATSPADGGPQAPQGQQVVGPGTDVAEGTFSVARLVRGDTSGRGPD